MRPVLGSIRFKTSEAFVVTNEAVVNEFLCHRRLCAGNDGRLVV